MNQSQQIIEALSKSDVVSRYNKIADDVFSELGLALPPTGKKIGQVQIKTTTRRSTHGVGVAWIEHQLDKEGNLATPIVLFMNKKFLSFDAPENLASINAVLAHEMIHVHLMGKGDFSPGNLEHGNTFKAVEQKLQTKMNMNPFDA